MSRFTYPALRRFAADLANCSRLLRAPFKAYGYLRSGRDPQVGEFHIKSLHFQGRKEDWVAIREVLVEDEYACVEKLFDPEDSPRVLDIGANIGCFALRVFLHCPNAQVVSVEAAADTFEVLRANQRVNPQRKWEAMNFGVWRDDGPLTLMRRGISVGHRVIEGVGTDVVQGISLQTLIGRLGWEQIDLIKMDIEGGEEAVIPAAISVLRLVRFLIIEVHNDRIDSEPVVKALHSVFSYCWQLNDRKSKKPVYIMAKNPLPFGAQE